MTSISPASTTVTPSFAPSALTAAEGEPLWFLGILATIKASTHSTAGRVAVIEHLAPRGSGSPLHVHHREDEWFYVVDGELPFWVGGQVITAPSGSFVYGPRDIPHTFTKGEQILSRRDAATTCSSFAANTRRRCGTNAARKWHSSPDEASSR